MTPWSLLGGRRAAALYVALVLAPACAPACEDRWDRVSKPYFELQARDAPGGRTFDDEVLIEGTVHALEGVVLLTWSLNLGPERDDFDTLDLSAGTFAVRVSPLDPGLNEISFHVTDRAGRRHTDTLVVEYED